jgi:hypothetical protein
VRFGETPRDYYATKACWLFPGRESRIACQKPTLRIGARRGAVKRCRRLRAGGLVVGKEPCLAKTPCVFICKWLRQLLATDAAAKARSKHLSQAACWWICDHAASKAATMANARGMVRGSTQYAAQVHVPPTWTIRRLFVVPACPNGIPATTTIRSAGRAKPSASAWATARSTISS